MNVRNIQKTGNMFYVYLPTSWCKEHKINSKSKVSVETNNDGSLTVSSTITKQGKKELNLHISNKDINIINKLIVACYINPINSFRITLDKEIDISTILNQKKLISGLEFVEYDKNKILCESSILVTRPGALLRTMITKIKNLLLVKMKHYNPELIERYKEEIRRNHFLIDKSAITFLTYNEKSTLKHSDLYYIATISHILDRMTSHIIHLKQHKSPFINQIYKIMYLLKDIFENITKEDINKLLNYKAAIRFAQEISSIKIKKVNNLESYSERRITRYLNNISENIINWSITNQVE